MINDLLDFFPAPSPHIGRGLGRIAVADSTTAVDSLDCPKFDNSNADFDDILSNITGDLFDGTYYCSEQTELCEPSKSKEETLLMEGEDCSINFNVEDILMESMKAWSDKDCDKQVSDLLDAGMEESVNNISLLPWHLCEQTLPDAVIKENENIKEGNDVRHAQKKEKSNSRKMTRKSSTAGMSVSSSSASISSLDKNNPNYIEKRERNNESVRKSRDKARQKQMETMEKVKVLTEENSRLNNKVNDLLKELEILKSLFANIANK
ncbi:hypothetical protein HELRODRAFT_167361 [Helobdella robusta]|uniref:BZIP domain-containing protein n=1 Tax=Helobdella robusta TaxID=6412 RepID=T1EZA9_HELRO|nr:hypothetical protein HELRODRAFT_167361 [Helobdella robusta]ESO10857.1 hypothetical protein HELRODRAFT_167361 [Helobdella robusta]